MFFFKSPFGKSPPLEKPPVKKMDNRRGKGEGGMNSKMLIKKATLYILTVSNVNVRLLTFQSIIK